MKRMLAAGVLVLATVAPLAGHAEIRDGKDCNSSGDTNAFVDNGIVEEPGNADNADRGAYCVRAGGTTVFYLGGEAQPEDPNNAGTAGLCGVLIVNGTSYGSGHQNANSDPDDWNFEHTHTNGSKHKHDCN